MKNWTKKIASVAIAALFIGFSSGHCREESYIQPDPAVSEAGPVPLYDKYECENFLFDFMRKSKLLSNWEATLDSVEEDLAFSTLPFSNLFVKLQEKLSELAQAEEDLAISKEDTRITELKNTISNLPIAETEEQLLQNLETIFDFQSQEIDCQNTLDSQSLLIAFKYDLDQTNNILIELNDSQKKALLNQIYEYSFTQYQAFIIENESVLKRIDKIANDGFIIKPQLCKNYKNQKFCVEASEGNAIKNLSELVDYSAERQELEEEIYVFFLGYQKGDFCPESSNSKNDKSKRNYGKKKNDFKKAYHEVKKGLKEAYSDVKPAVKKTYSNLKNKIKNVGEKLMGKHKSTRKKDRQ